MAPIVDILRSDFIIGIKDAIFGTPASTATTPKDTNHACRLL